MEIALWQFGFLDHIVSAFLKSLIHKYFSSTKTMLKNIINYFFY